MTMVLELPPPLEEELAHEAEKIGLPADALSRSLLWVASAIVYQTESNPLSGAVRELLTEHSVDPDEFGRMVGEFVQRLQPTADGGVDGMLIDGDTLLVWEVKHTPVETSSNGSPVRAERPSAMGKYAHLKWSSDDYARRKQEEIDLEDGRAA
jgi:hypothetical protein